MRISYMGYKWELWMDGQCISLGDDVLYENEDEAKEVAQSYAELKIDDWKYDNPDCHTTIDDIEVCIEEVDF